MKTITEYIRQHIYELLKMSEIELDKLVEFQCEWSANFMTLMINRLLMGHYRYGFTDRAVKKPCDLISSIHSRLKKYEEDGNLEHMVDIANIAMFEFEEGNHPKRHFKPIDDGEHVE